MIAAGMSGRQELHKTLDMLPRERVAGIVLNNVAGDP